MRRAKVVARVPDPSMTAAATPSSPPSPGSVSSDSPPPARFTLGMEVGDDDIDMLGHASNIAYLRWVQDVAVAHSATVGLDMEGYAQLGAVFVVRRHEIDYLRPVVRGEKLELRTWIDSASAAKCKRATEIVRIGTPEVPELVVARAMTTWGFIELATGRPTRIPDSVRVAFSQPTMRELSALRNSDPPPPVSG
ncbi:MAG: acyl-CoA thioester hydrolase [Myxococcales bacterium]|nr:acyl-CoA thioester hydrolase [Myxococcales bacterium]